MNRQVVNFLKGYSFNTGDINRLIVSSYLKKRGSLRVSKYISTFQIHKTDPDYKVFTEFYSLVQLETLEKVIEAFEFVISPREKVVTGAVYTPSFIRDYITTKAIDSVWDSPQLLIADISCGCAGFLLTAARELNKKSGRSYASIIEGNLFGLDIADYSIERSKIILSLLAMDNGETEDIRFNLFVGNALNYEWEHDSVKRKGGFDIIIGNPPYVASRNIDDESLILLENWSVARSGHPDLYIAFFEIGLKCLRQNGILSFITVNTFFKSVNGRALRSFFSTNKYDLTIIDFRGEQIFKGKSTYTCICTIRKRESEVMKFAQIRSNHLAQSIALQMTESKYSEHSDLNGWNLTTKKNVNPIKQIESFETKLFDHFSFSTGIATLKNAVYKFKNIRTVGGCYTLIAAGQEFQIEKSICREIINANKVTDELALQSLKDNIIFPYSWNKTTLRFDIIPEELLMTRFPRAYQYLLLNKKVLAKRDKSSTEDYDAWYAYGRRQGLNIQGIKLFLPHITKQPKFVVCDDAKLLFCNGEAIVGKNLDDILFLKRILESKIFWFYIVSTSKPYSSDFFSLGKNYLRSFSIPNFTPTERRFLIKEPNTDKVLVFLLEKYGLRFQDLPKMIIK